MTTSRYFVQATGSAGATVTRLGTQNTILMRNRDLDRQCPLGSATGPDDCGFSGGFTVSTAHARPGLTGSDFTAIIEIGWAELWEPGTPSSQAESEKDWFVFSRRYFNGNCLSARNQLAPNLNPGNTDIWRIEVNPTKPNGTTDWDLSVNFQIGAGWVLFDVFNVSWHTAVPLGEVERFGGGTGLAEDQTALKWNSNGSWLPWSDNACFSHTNDTTTLDWDYNQVSDTAWETIHRTAGAC